MRASDYTTEEAWRRDLLVTPTHKPKACLANALTVMRNTPAWHGVLAYDEFADAVKIMRPPPWQRGVNGGWQPRRWEDHDDILAADWLQHQEVGVPVAVAAQAVTAVAREASFHPIGDYLGSLTWDNEPRVSGFVHRYLGSEGSTYHAAVSRCLFITGVARVSDPGCKADHVPILEAGQGKLKSTAIEALTSPWFSDDLADLGSKDAAMQVRAAWCIEIAELSAMARPNVLLYPTVPLSQYVPVYLDVPVYLVKVVRYLS